MVFSARGSELSFSRTVNRELVHKSAVAEVLLTDSAQVEEDAYLVAAQWPRRHWHFGEPARALDPSLVAETLRQSCLLLATRHLGVSLDAHLTIDGLGVRLDQAKLACSAPAQVTVDVRASPIRTANGRIRDIAVEAVFLHEDTQIATAAGNAFVIPAATYRRVRGSVAISSSATTSAPATPLLTLHVDRGHAVYFDHESDHVPGMLLVDAALNAARERLGSTRRMCGFEATFDGFVEFEPTTYLEVSTEMRSQRVFVDFVQSAKRLARVTVSADPVSRSG